MFKISLRAARVNADLNIEESAQMQMPTSSQRLRDQKEAEHPGSRNFFEKESKLKKVNKKPVPSTRQDSRHRSSLNKPQSRSIFI